MMHSTLPSSPPTSQRWKLGVSGIAGGSTSHNDQLEAFLRERLERWEPEAAEVIAVWGRVGGMCSAEYQSQLRRAHTAIEDAQRKERLRETTLQARQGDSMTATHRRQRDRLAAEAWTRAQAELNAARRRRERQSHGAPVVAAQTAAASQQPAPAQEREVTALRAALAAVAHAAATPVPSAPRTPAPPTSNPPTATVRRPASGIAGLRQSLCERKLELREEEEEDDGESDNSVVDLHAEQASSLSEHSASTSASTAPTASSSNLSLYADDDGEHEEVAVARQVSPPPVVTPPRSTGSLSGTFIVRRRLSTSLRNVAPSMAAYQHALPHSRAGLYSPAPVAPSPPLPAQRATRRRCLPSHTATPSQQVTVNDPLHEQRDTAITSSSPDCSLSCPSRDVTAIFASGSRSRENPSGSRQRQPTRERVVDELLWTTSPRDDVDTNTQESTATGQSQSISPIKVASNVDDLASLSSAGSYGDADGDFDAL